MKLTIETSDGQTRTSDIPDRAVAVVERWQKLASEIEVAEYFLNQIFNQIQDWSDREKEYELKRKLLEEREDVRVDWTEEERQQEERRRQKLREKILAERPAPPAAPPQPARPEPEPEAPQQADVPPKAPTNLIANAGAKTVSWDAVPGATEYEPKFWSNRNRKWVSLGRTTTTTTSDSQMRQGDRYLVHAINEHGTSPASNEAHAV